MFFKDITLKESSTLKANGRLIVGNTVLFQISVASDEESVSGKILAYYLYLLLNFPRSAILDYMWRDMVAQLFRSHKRCSHES